jgi:hypothetical protein
VIADEGNHQYFGGSIILQAVRLAVNAGKAEIGSS